MIHIAGNYWFYLSTNLIHSHNYTKQIIHYVHIFIHEVNIIRLTGTYACEHNTYMGEIFFCKLWKVSANRHVGKTDVSDERVFEVK